MLITPDYSIVLASQSPRRKELLKALGFNFTTISINIAEVYPVELKCEQIALYLSKLKSDAAYNSLNDNNVIIISADTIVWANNTCLGKPKDKEEAITMLKVLSGNKHIVSTAICFRKGDLFMDFFSKTEVFFRKISDHEIDYYIENYKPYDKAGSYGIQEWIGEIAIERINGSYTNVVGFPTSKFYVKFKSFLKLIKEKDEK